MLRKCLEKDPKKRLRDIGDWGELLLEPSAPGQNRVRPTWWMVVAGVFILIAAGASWIAYRATRPVDRPLVRLDVDLGPDVALPDLNARGSHNVTLSPDGTRLAYLSGNPPRLYTRRLDQPNATELRGTEQAIRPFFSPDGKWVGFFTGVSAKKLSKISVDGGAVIPIADFTSGIVGASWGDDGNIIVGGLSRGLLQVPATGGAPTPILEVAPGESQYGYPQILPGGKAVLFMNRGPDRNADSIEVFSFADRRRKTVVRVGTSGLYLPSGHLIYTNDGTLFAAAFDVDRLDMRRSAVPVLNDVAWSRTGGVDADFARTGTLVYRRGGGNDTSRKTVQWVDATGRKEPLPAKPGDYVNLRISPDGKRLAFVNREGSIDVWAYDLQRDVMTRLTFGGGIYSYPLWSSDGRYVVFSTLGRGIAWTRADGSGQPQSLIQSSNQLIPWSFTPDGKRLAYFDLAGNPQIWTVPLEEQGSQLKAGKPEQFLKSQFADVTPAFSPDGRWLAYVSNESGKLEVYVRAFPPPASGQGGQWQMSNGPGVPNGPGTSGPQWSRNGHELVYQQDGHLMAASYSVSGDSFVAEKPRVWIEKLGGTYYDLAPDGKRVAVLTPVSAPDAPKAGHEVTILFNFFDELRRRVPVGK